MGKNNINDFIKYSKEQMEYLMPKWQEFIENELDLEISSLKARELINFATLNLGRLCYNKGIEDSIAYMNDKVEDLYVLIRE